MELVWLEDYLALAGTLNFSRAAEARHITQPAFSRRIRALERWVGTPLFARTTHGVALTDAGAHFHGQAEILTRALLQLRRDTVEVAGRAAKLSIASTHALSFTFFPGWVRRHDSVLAWGNLNLISDSMQACEQIMLRGDAPFLLCHYHPAMGCRLDGQPFESITVGADTLLPLCAPALGPAANPGRGRRGRSRTPRWHLGVAGKPVRYLAYSAESGLGRIVAAGWGAKSGAKSRGLARDTVFTSHLAATLLSMACAGDGVAWLPRSLAEEDLAAGRLVRAADRTLQIPVEIRLFRPTARQSPAIETMWEAFERR